MQARLIFGLLSVTCSPCGSTRSGGFRSQCEYSVPAADARRERMGQKTTLFCDGTRAQQSRWRAFVWKLVIIKLSHGWEEIMSLIFCASQTFVSHPNLEICDGTGQGSRTSVIWVKPHKSEVHLTKGEIEAQNGEAACSRS